MFCVASSREGVCVCFLFSVCVFFFSSCRRAKRRHKSQMRVTSFDNIAVNSEATDERFSKTKTCLPVHGKFLVTISAYFQYPHILLVQSTLSLHEAQEGIQ